MIPPLYLNQLEEAARAATQGEWYSTGVVIAIPGEGGMTYILEALTKNHDADMRYLELVQPQHVLAMLEEMRTLQTPVLVVEKEPDYWSDGHFHEGTKPWINPAAVRALPIGTKLCRVDEP